jgi:hypothetical protein
MAFVMLTSATALWMAASCPAPPPVKVEVVAAIEGPVVALDFSSEEIRNMRGHNGAASLHQPYGFYTGSVGYLVVPVFNGPPNDICAGSIDLRLTIQLFDRRIQIGRDLRDDPCKFREIVAHYKRHAQSDEGFFAAYIRNVTTALAGVALHPLSGDNTMLDSDLANVNQTVRGMIDPVLAGMDQARSEAISAVDSPADVMRLGNGCGDHA